MLNLRQPQYSSFNQDPISPWRGEVALRLLGRYRFRSSTWEYARCHRWQLDHWWHLGMCPV